MLARTGGTVLSKCLGSMDGIVLLSEIHPDYVNNLDELEQAQVWFDLLTPADEKLFRLKKGYSPKGRVSGKRTENVLDINFGDIISLIQQRCVAQEKILVIRDWSHIDFTGVPFVLRPEYRLKIADILAKHFSVAHTALVRHPVDQWLSLQSAHQQVDYAIPTLESFLHGYLRFAEHCLGIGFVRYEDFVLEPEHQLRLLCDRLELPFDPGFKERWFSYHTISGDLFDHGRGGREIKPLPRREMKPGLLEEFEQNADYVRSLKILEYQHPELSEVLEAPNQQVNDEYNANTVNDLGEQLFAQGETSCAFEAFERAIELEPNFPTAHNNMGVLYWQAGEGKKALEHFSLALEIDPNHRDTVLNCGQVFKALNRLDETRNIYLSYLAHHPDDAEISHQLAELATIDFRFLSACHE